MKNTPTFSSLLAVTFALGGAAHAQTFGESLSYEGVRLPRDTIEFGDIDGDGVLDLVCPSEGHVNLTWQRGISGGFFGPSRELSFDMEAYSSFSTSIADLDGDGDEDIMTTNLQSTSYGAIRTYENLGRGRFGTPKTVAGTPSSAFHGSVVDIDGDGVRDLLFSSGDMRVCWCRNLGAMNFGAASVVVDAGVIIQQVIASDLEGDGDLDVVFRSPDQNIIFQVENLGGGDFGPSRTATAQFDRPKDLAVADLDGDGDMDILSFGSDGYQVGWCSNLGTGKFAPPKYLEASAWSSPIGMSAGDIDGDGDTDVVVSWRSADGLTWFENSGGGVFGAATQIVSTYGLSTVSVLVDLDQDGDLDPVVTCDGPGSYGALWAENRGSGAFQPLMLLSTSTRSLTSYDVADLDADGDLDLVASDSDADELVVIENPGNGEFRGSTVIGTGLGRVFSTEAADMDGDGDLDVVTGSAWDSKASVHWYENKGSGAFARQVQLMSTVAGSHALVSLWDFDRDGDMDVLAEYSSYLFDDRVAAWIRNDGAGKFTALDPGGVGRQAISVPVDVDGDSDLDLVALEFFSETAKLNVHGTKEGVIGAAQPLDVMINWGPSLAASDFDGDGSTDLLVVNGVEVRIYPGAGGPGGVGLGAASTLVTLGQAATGIAMLDLDADGDDDLVTHSRASATWFENLGNGLIGPGQAITGWSRQQLSSRLGAADLDGDKDIDLYREISTAYYRERPSRLMVHLNEERSEVRYGRPGTANSSGRAANITVSGSSSVSVNDLLLIASHMPAEQLGLFIVAGDSGLAPAPGGAGANLCVGGGAGRMAWGHGEIFLSSPSGDATVPLELAGNPNRMGPAPQMAGDTRYFRGWFRDVKAGATSQFTGGVWVTFLP